MNHFYKIIPTNPNSVNCVISNLKAIRKPVIYMGGDDAVATIGKPRAFIALGHDLLFVPQSTAFKNPRSFAKAMAKFIGQIKPQYTFIINAKMFTGQEMLSFSRSAGNGKVILWYGDQRGRPSTEDIRRACGADYFAMSNIGTNKYFTEHGTKPHFMPCEAMTEIFKPLSTPNTRKKDIVFVGNCYDENAISNDKTKRISMTRILVIKKLKERYGNRFDVYGFNWHKHKIPANAHVHVYKMPAIYDQYKIIIGHNSFGYIDRYVSNRFWNALAMGHVHITNKTNGLEHLMENGKQACWYESIEELYSLIDKYLADIPASLEMGKQAHSFIMENHTPVHRIRELLKDVDATPKLRSKVIRP